MLDGLQWSACLCMGNTVQIDNRLGSEIGQAGEVFGGGVGALFLLSGCGTLATIEEEANQEH